MDKSHNDTYVLHAHDLSNSMTDQQPQFVLPSDPAIPIHDGDFSRAIVTID